MNTTPCTPRDSDSGSSIMEDGPEVVRVRDPDLLVGSPRTRSEGREVQGQVAYVGRGGMILGGERGYPGTTGLPHAKE